MLLKSLVVGGIGSLTQSLHHVVEAGHAVEDVTHGVLQFFFRLLQGICKLHVGGCMIQACIYIQDFEMSVLLSHTLHLIWVCLIFVVRALAFHRQLWDFVRNCTRKCGGA